MPVGSRPLARPASKGVLTLSHPSGCCAAAAAALQAELSAVLALLEEHALDRTITLDHTLGSRGEALTTLTLVCKPDDGDEVAAALLQVLACVRRLSHH